MSQRTKITQELVSEIAERLMDSGQCPTNDRIIGEIGYGSKSTVQPMLKKWRDSSQSKPAREPMSDFIRDTFESVITQIDDCFKRHYREQISQSKEAMEMYQQQAHDRLEQYIFDNERIKQELNKQKNLVEVCEQEAEELKGKIQKITVDKMLAEKMLDEVREKVNEVTRENKMLHQHIGTLKVSKGHQKVESDTPAINHESSGEGGGKL